MNNLHIILLIVILVLLVVVYKRENFIDSVICNTVGKKEDCLSYGCDMKNIKVDDIKCIDDNYPDDISKKINNCSIRRETNRDKLETILESVELSNEDLYHVDNIFNQDNRYLRLVRPGKSFYSYLKDEDKKKRVEIYNNELISVNNDINKWVGYSNNLVFSYGSVNLVKIMTVDTVEYNRIKVRVDNVNVSLLKFKNNKFLDQINSFDYCYKLGGNEVNYGNNLVKCDFAVDYDKCEKKNSTGMGMGCFLNKSRESCLFNTDNGTENNCKWVSSYTLSNNPNKNVNYYKGYCVEKSYEIDQQNLYNECLFKNKAECDSSTNCIVDDTTDKCLNKKYMKCDDINSKDQCNSDLDCLWDDNYKECNVKKNIVNLLRYKDTDEVSLNIPDNIDNSIADDYFDLAMAYENEIDNKEILKF